MLGKATHLKRNIELQVCHVKVVIQNFWGETTLDDLVVFNLLEMGNISGSDESKGLSPELSM